MDLSKENWIVANGNQVWRNGHNAVTSPRICTVQNAAKPVEQFTPEEQAQIAYLLAAAPKLLTILGEYLVLGMGRCHISKELADAALATVNEALGGAR